MKRYYVVCAGVTAVLIGATMYFRSEPTKFYGIADTKETVINIDASVEIRKIPVVQGQTVTEGDTLVVLDRPELVMKINEISHMLSEYKARKTYQTTTSRSEMKRIQAEQTERINEIKAKIRELEAQYEMNRKLVAELRSLENEETGEADSSANPILAQIKSLRNLLESARDPSQIQIDRINRQLTEDDNPLKAQVQRLSDELALLEEARQNLIIRAQKSGMIGMVKFKEGEKVSPFDTILTLHAAAPSYVKGYIHENVYSHVAVGDTVRVTSFSNEKLGITGRVVGVGSRIVDYPERLRKRQEIPIWGREVIIKLPEDNSLLLGEKVLISVLEKKNGFSFAAIRPINEVSAAEVPISVRNVSAMRDIHVRKSITDVPLEASGLCYLPDSGIFVVVSDDTKRNRPELFLMDTGGVVNRSELVHGIEAIDDMEAVTAGHDGQMYLLASQSHNRKGKLRRERKLLVRLRRNGTGFRSDGTVVLIDLLAHAARKAPSAAWAGFISRAVEERSADIEGMAWYDGALLMGFKNPKRGHDAVILSISDPDAMFRHKRIAPAAVRLWRHMTLVDTATATFCGIADLCVVDGMLYGVSTGVGSRSGVDTDVGLFWCFDPGTDRLQVLHSFTGVKPEGIARNSDNGLLYIVFDNGTKNASQMMTVKVAP